MGSTADIPKYEEMIEAISRFVRDVDGAGSEMGSAGNECVENCNNDSASTKSNEKLKECISRLQESTEIAGQIQSALQEELERLYELRRIESEIDSD